MLMEPAALRHPAQAILALIALLLPGFAQRLDPTEIGQQPFVQRQATPNVSQTAPQTLTLQDALTLAQKNDPSILVPRATVNWLREDSSPTTACMSTATGLRCIRIYRRGRSCGLESSALMQPSP
jgi:hypothetical protein